MTPGAIGRRYGRALFELASERNASVEVGAGLSELASAVESLSGGTLAPSLLPPSQREQLGNVLAMRLGSDSLLGKFIGLLARNDRLAQLPAIRDSFEKLQDVSARRVRIHIRSAVSLSDEERTGLRIKFEAITGRQVLDTAEVQADLLGGVAVEAEGRIYDGSIRTQLARLERRMAG